MQKIWRKWLVGIGLLVTLLALAVPAMAATPSNKWVPQTTPAPSFNTRVQAIAAAKGVATGATLPIQVDVGTYGGAYPTNNQGNLYQSADTGANFTLYNPANAPVATNITKILWDGTFEFVGVYGKGLGVSNTDGLYRFDGTNWVLTTNNPVYPDVNNSVTCVAVDPSNKAATPVVQPHIVYFGTNNGGVFQYTGALLDAAFSNITGPTTGYPQDVNAQNITAILVIPYSPAVGLKPAVPLTIFVGTEGSGAYKGVYNSVAHTWSWSPMAGISDTFVTSLAALYPAGGNYWNNFNNTLLGANTIFAGTKTSGIFMSQDLGATWTAAAATQAITAPVTDLLAYYQATGSALHDKAQVFAATEGQGVYRLFETAGQFAPINTGWYDSIGNFHYDLMDLRVYALSGYLFDPGTASPTFYLFAGTDDGTGVGNLWSIPLQPLQNAASKEYGITTVGTYSSSRNQPVGLVTADPDGTGTTTQVLPHWTINDNPGPWAAQLDTPPAGLSAAYYSDSPVDPADARYFAGQQVWLQGSPDDCNTNPMQLWVTDALGNWYFHRYNPINILPHASILSNPGQPYDLGQLVTFSATLSGITGNVAYAWNFGDGNTSTLPSPSHAYSAIGSYVVSLTITDSACGAYNTYTATYNVTVQNSFSITPQVVAQSGLDVWFQANPLNGHAPYTIAYDYGSAAATPPTQTLVWDGTGVEPKGYVHYANYGTFTITVTVTDSLGKTAHITMTYIFTAQSATMFYSNPNPAPGGYPVTFSMNSTFSGFAAPQYTLDFGDGTAPYVSVGCVPGVVTTTHVYTLPVGVSQKNYTATLTADASVCTPGGPSTITTLTQSIYAPFTSLALARTSASCTHYVGDTLTFSLKPTGGLAPFRYVVTWGDGKVSEYLAPDANAYTVSHAYALPGSYTVSAIGYDAQGGGVVVSQVAVPPITVAIDSPVTQLAATFGGYKTCTQLPGGVAYAISYVAPAGWSNSNVANIQYTIAVTKAGVMQAGFPFVGTGIPWGAISWAPPVPANAPVDYVMTVTFKDPVVPGSTTYCKTATSTVAIKIYKPLTAPVSINWTAGCDALTVNFDASGFTGGVPPFTYFWKFGDGQTTTTTSLTTSHTYATANTYTVVLTVKDSMSNTCGVATMPNQTSLNFNVALIPPFTYTVAGQAPQVAVGTSFKLTCSTPTGGSGAGFSYLWSFFKDNVPAVPTFVGTSLPTSQSPTVSFGAAGNWVASVAVADLFDPSHFVCIKTVNVLVVPALGCGTMTVTTTQGVLPLPVTMNNTWMNGVYPMTLVINWGDGTTPDTQVFTAPPAMPVQTLHIYKTASPATGYNAVSTLTDSNLVPASCSNFVTIQVQNPAPLTVTTTTLVNGQAGNAGTAPLTVSFGAVPQGGVAPYTFLWDFKGDGTATSTDQNPVYTYQAKGVYNAKLTVTDSDPSVTPSGKSVTVFVTITVYDPMSATLSADKTSGGKPLNVNFTTAALGGTLTYAYTYNFGDGSSSVGPATIAHSYNTAGNYYATVTVTDTASNAVISNQVLIRVYDPLTVTASAGPNLVGDTPLQVNFTATATGGDQNYTYAWVFGDTGTGTGKDASHTYTTASAPTFAAFVVVTDGLGNTATSNTIIVKTYAPMLASIATTSSAVGVAPYSVPFTSSVSGGSETYSYSWNFGDGTTDGTANPTHVFSHAGNYSVTLTVKDNASPQHVVTTNTINIAVYSTLAVTLAATPNAGTSPLSVAFAANATGGDNTKYQFAFDYGDGTTGSQPNHIYLSATGSPFTAKVTVTDPTTSQTASATASVTVYAPLTASISASATSGTTPFAPTFTANVGGGDGSYTYFWNFGDGTTSTSASPAKTYTTAGNFSVTLTVTDGSSHTAVSNTINMTVYGVMSVTLAGTPTAGILPLPVTFTAIAAGGDGHYTYSFDYGDGTTGSNPNHTYTVAGTYAAKVTATDTASHTATSNTVTITVWGSLAASISASATSGTTPFAPTFTANVGGGDGSYTYFWNFGDGTTSTSASPAKTYTTAGNFSVTLTVTDGSSHTAVSNTINMTVWAPLAISASATPNSLVGAGSVAFNALATGGDTHYSYAWAFGDGSTGTGATVNHSYAVGAKPNFTYTATVTVNDGSGHSASQTITITVKPVPPTIQSAVKMNPPTVPEFRLKLLGSNFQSGCTVTVGGTPVTVKFKSGGEIILLNVKSLLPKKVAVPIVVTNPDGGISNTFQFAR